MVEVGDKVFVKSDDKSINRMKWYLTNDKIIRHIINNPDEIYEVAYKGKDSVMLSEFANMGFKYIPIECVGLAQKKALYQIRRESIQF
jgi:hypothetical protein